MRALTPHVPGNAFYLSSVVCGVHSRKQQSVNKTLSFLASVADKQNRTVVEQTILQTTGTRVFFTEHFAQKSDALFEPCAAFFPALLRKY